jgi:hypothetical protein
LAGLASADVLSSTSSRDNTLIESSIGGVSNGVGAGMFAGRTAQANNSIRRGLLAFDISSIPAGSTIDSVTLRLFVNQTSSGTADVSLHRVLASWGEGASNSGASGGGSGAPARANDATWLHRFSPGTFWAAPGGDFTSTASAVIPVDNFGAYEWTGAGLVADVQAWLDNPSLNNGWLVRGDESASSTAKRFATREEAIEDQRPLLTITYTVPTPGAAGVLAGAGLLAARRRRR